MFIEDKKVTIPVLTEVHANSMNWEGDSGAALAYDLGVLDSVYAALNASKPGVALILTNTNLPILKQSISRARDQVMKQLEKVD